MGAHTCPLWGWEQHTRDEVQGPIKILRSKIYLTVLRIPTKINSSLQIQIPSA